MSVLKQNRTTITDGLVGDDKEEARRQRGELDKQLDELFSITGTIWAVGGDVAPASASFVLTGTVVPGNLPDGVLHRDIIGDDLHIPKVHAPTHLPSGTDPLDTGIPVGVGLINAEGTADNFARSDHVHVARPGALADENFADDITPTGTIDGVNDTFSLPTVPDPAASLQLFKNGILQESTSKFVLTVDTIVFTALNIPQSTGTPDILRAWYRLVPSGVGFRSPLYILGIAA